MENEEGQVGLEVFAVIAGLQAQQSATSDKLIQSLMVDSKRLRVLKETVLEYAEEQDSKRAEAKIANMVYRVMKMKEEELDERDAYFRSANSPWR